MGFNRESRIGHSTACDVQFTIAHQFMLVLKINAKQGTELNGLIVFPSSAVRLHLQSNSSPIFAYPSKHWSCFASLPPVRITRVVTFVYWLWSEERLWCRPWASVWMTMGCFRFKSCGYSVKHGNSIFFILFPRNSFAKPKPCVLGGYGLLKYWK